MGSFSDNLKKINSNQRIIIGLLVIIALTISIQRIGLGVKNFWGGEYTHYNNYVIFKYSFLHLIENVNLYSYYSNEYGDLYKYSPTFALFMGFFYYIPDILGLFIWNLLNILVLYYAIFSLKIIDPSKRIFIIFFVLFELILSTQNSQSNALIAGLTIMVYNMLEKGKNVYASFFIVLGTFIKLYSIAGCILLLLYPQKLKSILSLLIWTIIFFLLPLIVTDFSSLISQYKNWLVMLKTDQDESTGMSLFEYIKIISPEYFKSITFAIGFLMLTTPLLKFKMFTNSLFRIQYLAFILVGMIIFNHKAESPTYIIAMTGIGIWYLSSKQSRLNTILVLLCLFFTSIWFTDIVPRDLKNYFIESKFIKPIFPTIILCIQFLQLILPEKVDDKKLIRN